ncbi:MAG: IS110 family transposase [Burkholderiaceae bacterium]
MSNAWCGADHRHGHGGRYAGSVSHFSSARHFASWLRLTPREHSSGNRQRLGRASVKRGDKYLRMLLVHGARAVLRSATLRTNRGQQPGPIRHWGQNIQRRCSRQQGRLRRGQQARPCVLCGAA